MSHIVHCKFCNAAFDRDLLVEDIDWVQPSNRQYYHKACFDNWVNMQGQLDKEMSDNGWLEALKYYLGHEIKVSINYGKLISQWNNFLKQKKTAKGIYFAVRYFYDCTDGDKTKAQGGIGIVPFIYQESCNYWQEKFVHDMTIIEKIERQARAQAMRGINVVKQTKPETVKKKKPISLDDIE